MVRVMVKVADKAKAKELKKYGSLIYTSPILNLIGLEMNPDKMTDLKNDSNVISAEPEAYGRLQFN